MTPADDGSPEPDGEERLLAARLAGWNPADGRPPFRHSLPPPNDHELGNNGIRPTNAERTA